MGESTLADMLVAFPVANLTLASPYSVAVVATVTLDHIDTGQRVTFTTDNQPGSLEVGNHVFQQEILHLCYPFRQCRVACPRHIAAPVALVKRYLWPVGITRKDHAKHQLVALL